MTPSFDIIMYILAFILFGFAAFDVHFGRPAPGWGLRWEWAAFCVLTLSLIF
jgi:hypothetical protein